MLYNKMVACRSTKNLRDTTKGAQPHCVAMLPNMYIKSIFFTFNPAIYTIYFHFNLLTIV